MFKGMATQHQELFVKKCNKDCGFSKGFYKLLLNSVPKLHDRDNTETQVLSISKWFLPISTNTAVVFLKLNVKALKEFKYELYWVCINYQV